MLPQQAFDRTDRPLGRVIGMDLDKQGEPKGYVILLEGDAAQTLMGAARGLLVVPVEDADVMERPVPEAASAEAVLVLRSAMERLKRGWAGAKAPMPEDEDPAAW